MLIYHCSCVLMKSGNISNFRRAISFHIRVSVGAYSEEQIYYEPQPIPLACQDTGVLQDRERHGPIHLQCVIVSLRLSTAGRGVGC